MAGMEASTPPATREVHPRRVSLRPRVAAPVTLAARVAAATHPRCAPRIRRPRVSVSCRRRIRACGDPATPHSAGAERLALSHVERLALSRVELILIKTKPAQSALLAGLRGDARDAGGKR